MQIHAAPHRIEAEELDGYGRRGVVIDRDSAHRVIAALSTAIFDLRSRPCEANEKGAVEYEEIKQAIGKALA